MGTASGSNQFVTQQVYCQPSHTANHKTSACSAHQGQVVQQAVGDLGDREDVHQVEEQLDEGDAGFVAVAAAQQVGACEKGHEEAAWLWWRSQISASPSAPDRQALQSPAGRGGDATPASP